MGTERSGRDMGHEELVIVVRVLGALTVGALIGLERTFHGRPAGFNPTLGRIEGESLFEAFAGYGGYRNLVYFAACSVLRGKRGLQFGRDFLKASGTRALIGYTTPVNWMASLVADMLFLHRFYSDPAPWRNLRRIFASVLRDYPRARSLGYTLLTR